MGIAEQAKTSFLDADYLLYIVKLAKGLLTDKSAWQFYLMLTNKEIFPRRNTPEDPQEARDLLRKAWWIEEEDITQWALEFLHKTNIPRTTWKIRPYITYGLAHHLVVKEKVFMRLSGWEPLYKTNDEQRIISNQLNDSEYNRLITLGQLIKHINENPKTAYPFYLIYSLQHNISRVQLANRTRIGVLEMWKYLKDKPTKVVKKYFNNAL